MTITDRLARRAHDEIMARAKIIETMAGGTITLEIRLDAAGLPKRIRFAAEHISQDEPSSRHDRQK